MPANLPPQFVEIERKLKSASTNGEKIEIIEELLSIIPKHKGTEKLRAMYKTKMAKLKAAAQKKATTAKHGPSHAIKSSGGGQMVLIGPPNAGKSALVKSLTNAEPLVSDYPFSTHSPYPAMMKFENIQIQLVDTPPITPDYMEVWHPELVKNADGVILLADAADHNSVDLLNQIIDKLKEKRIDLYSPIRPEGPGNGLFKKKTLLVLNKIDLLADQEPVQFIREWFQSSFNPLTISAVSGTGLDSLKIEIFKLLNIVRVFSKIPGKKAVLSEPYTLPQGSTVMDLAKTVHKEFSQKLKFARIWSKERYEGQKVNREYVLADEDIIELHI